MPPTMKLRSRRREKLQEGEDDVSTGLAGESRGFRNVESAPLGLDAPERAIVCVLGCIKLRLSGEARRVSSPPEVTSRLRGAHKC